ncbi:MAG: DUF309 domain-containing protein [Candidatus Rokubacteria bacterium]|nr:DUF309 domain-containing protein [Candidatus Rokubacteria bacterium]
MLPLPLRNRLAELILDSLRDPTARNTLSVLVRFCGEPEDAPAPPELAAEFPAALRKEHRRFRKELCDRALNAWDVVRARALAPAEPALAEALDQAADLFDAGLFFEVHELLEPYWMRGEGPAREALQGLIQVAVGFQHLANGNLEGARMLLQEGSAKVEGKKLEGRDLSGFGRAARLGASPRFPRGG